MEYDVVIIGSGPAGLTAGIYTARKELKTLILYRDLGQAATAKRVENWPGEEVTKGKVLVEKIVKHAKKLGCELKAADVTKISKTKDKLQVLTEKGIYDAKSVIIATGRLAKNLEIPGEKEFLGRGVAYCATCLPPEESIIVNSSIKKIKDVTPLTRVLTLEGGYKEISGFTKRNYIGKLVKIRPRFFNEQTLLTPNHPVYSVKLQKQTKEIFSKKYPKLNPEWIPAGDLKKGDLVLYPILKEKADINEIELSKFIEVKKEGESITPFIKTHTSNEIKDKIKVDTDFVRLIGYYIAEGTVNKSTLFFFFKKDEKVYINDVKCILKEKFGLNPTLKYEKNVCRITIYSKIIADFFKSQFGKYSYQKHLPLWAVLLPAEKQKELIKGLWRGDGCMRDKDFCYVTCSRELTYQMRDVLLRLGVIPSIQIREKEKLNREINRIEGRLVCFNHDKYHINVGGQFLEKMSEILEVAHKKIKQRKTTCKHAYLNDSFAFLPIRETSEVDYAGTVLNLAVEDTQTYVAKNFIVHNCDAPFFKNKTVAVIGGGNMAFDSAYALSRVASKVYLIHRNEEFKADKKLVTEIKKIKNIEIITSATVEKITGEKIVKGITVKDAKGKTKEVKVDGVFISVGFVPPQNMLDGLKTDKDGYIIADETMSTNIEGVFSAGDITNVKYKQMIVAAGEGAKAGLSVYNYLKNKKFTVDY